MLPISSSAHFLHPPLLFFSISHHACIVQRKIFPNVWMLHACSSTAKDLSLYLNASYILVRSFFSSAPPAFLNISSCLCSTMKALSQYRNASCLFCNEKLSQHLNALYLLPLKFSIRPSDFCTSEQPFGCVCVCVFVCVRGLVFDRRRCPRLLRRVDKSASFTSYIHRVGQNHIYIYGVYTVFLAGKWPIIRSYMAYISNSGQPYICFTLLLHLFACVHAVWAFGE